MMLESHLQQALRGWLLVSRSLLPSCSTSSLRPDLWIVQSLVAASEVNGGWTLKISSALGGNSSMKNQGLCDYFWATKYGQYTWNFNLAVPKFLDPKRGNTLPLYFSSTS